MTKRINRIERLARREEKATVKRILILSAVSAVIIFAIFTAGPRLLAKFADLVDVVFKNKSISSQTAATTLSTPILDEIPQATNSATLKISGYSSDGQKINVYKDGQKIADTAVSGGRFEYDNISLSNGSNEIKVQAISNSGAKSDFSQVANVIFTNKEPQLSVTTPSDGQSFSGDNHISVQGTTNANNQVFANGFLANVASDGKFSVPIPLVNGDNNVEVKALDDAGNTKIIKLKVHFSS